jgi:hypothetical protein
VTLIERSFVCPTGGGFETERWSVRINDGWLALPALVRRGSVGGVRVEVLDEDDPDGVARAAKWGDRAPQVWFKRSTRIVAPIGTGLWQRIWRPLIDPKRILEYPLPQRAFDEHFELRGEDRIVAVQVLAQRRAERAAARQPLTKEETRSYASALLSSLGEADSSAMTAPAQASMVDGPDTAEEPSAQRGRRVPVRTLSLPGELDSIPSGRRSAR